MALSLVAEDVADHWRQLSPELADLLALLERTEDWTLDAHPDIAERLVRFGLKLSDPNAARRLEAANRDELLFFLVYISSSKAFRIIHWMDEMHDGLGTRLLGVLLEQDADGFVNVLDPMLAGTLLQRLRAVQNTPFFVQLLNPHSLSAIERAIESYQRERESHENA